MFNGITGAVGFKFAPLCVFQLCLCPLSFVFLLTFLLSLREMIILSSPILFIYRLINQSYLCVFILFSLKASNTFLSFHGLSLNNTDSFCRARFPHACHSYLRSMIVFSFPLAAFKITSLPAASRIFCKVPFAVFLLYFFCLWRVEPLGYLSC